MDRRAFLLASARIAALAALGPLGACAQPAGPVKFDRDPFMLGVASGIRSRATVPEEELDEEARDRVERAARLRLGEKAFAQYWRRGESSEPRAALSEAANFYPYKEKCKQL